MDVIFAILKYAVLGFFGLIALLFLLALLFGKRKRTEWEYEAEFRDARRRKIGEFDVERSRIENEEQDFTQKYSFYLRHPELPPQGTVRVWLDDVLVLEGMVHHEGHIRMGNCNLQNDIAKPQTGQLAKVECNGRKLFASPVHPD